MRTVYVSSGGGGGGGGVGGGGVVIGNDTTGPTSASSLLQTPLQPPQPTPLVGQPNVTGGGGAVVVVGGVGGGGGGGGDALDGGYWWWALLAVFLVLATAAGNILVCLAITWERRLQNVTNYFLMSLAVTDLMVAVLVMPVGILTLIKGTCSAAPLKYNIKCAIFLPRHAFIPLRTYRDCRPGSIFVYNCHVYVAK